MYRSPLLNKAIIPALALGALTYALYATGVMRPKKIEEAPLWAPPVRAFDETIAAVGLVEPSSELVAVSPRVAGWIETVHVSVGQSVRAGDPLFTLDGADQRAELWVRQQSVEVARARLERLRASPRAEDVPIARALVSEAEAILGDARTNLELVEEAARLGAATSDELLRRRWGVKRAEAQLETRQAELGRLLSGAWKEDIAVAEREEQLALAAVRRTEADLDRLTTRAPMDAVVLRLTARAGQYAPTGVLEEPLATLGSSGPLHVRADINEEDASRVRPGSGARAMLRGAAASPIELEFVRIEPLVVPKRALSGLAPERVDTRALQVIFSIKGGNQRAYVGQQVDVYIDASGERGNAGRGDGAARRAASGAFEPRLAARSVGFERHTE